MHRTTILLPKALHRQAEREAGLLGISLSELIRRRLEATQDPNVKKTPAFFTRQPWVDCGATDMAKNHDAYLYGQ